MFWGTSHDNNRMTLKGKFTNNASSDKLGLGKQDLRSIGSKSDKWPPEDTEVTVREKSLKYSDLQGFRHTEEDDSVDQPQLNNERRCDCK